MINDWENAQLNYQKAIIENEKAKDSSGTALAYMNMAYLFSDVNDWENAARNLEKSIHYLGANSKKDYQAVIFGSLAESYSRLFKLNEAKTYLQKSDSLVHLFPTASNKTFYFIGKGEYALSSKDYPTALAATISSLQYARQWGDSAFVAYAMGNIGRTYMVLGKYAEAASWLTRSNDIAVRYNYMPQRKIMLKQMFQLYRENGQSERAVAAAMELFT